MLLKSFQNEVRYRLKISDDKLVRSIIFNVYLVETSVVTILYRMIQFITMLLNCLQNDIAAKGLNVLYALLCLYSAVY
jgi:hypothetical protein